MRGENEDDGRTSVPEQEYPRHYSCVSVVIGDAEGLWQDLDAALRSTAVERYGRHVSVRGGRGIFLRVFASTEPSVPSHGSREASHGPARGTNARGEGVFLPREVPNGPREVAIASHGVKIVSRGGAILSRGAAIGPRGHANVPRGRTIHSRGLAIVLHDEKIAPRDAAIEPRDPSIELRDATILVSITTITRSKQADLKRLPKFTTWTEARCKLVKGQMRSGSANRLQMRVEH